MSSKAERITLARTALDAFLHKNGSSGDRASDIQDLVSDLMHLAAAEKTDPYRLIETSVSHYVAEAKKDPALPVIASLDVSIRKPKPKGQAGYADLWTRIHPLRAR